MNTFIINNKVKKKENSIEVIELGESEDEKYELIHLDEKENNNTRINSNNLNKQIKWDKYNIDENNREITNNMYNNIEPKVLITFEESLVKLKDNFTKLFITRFNNDSKINIWNNESFHNTFINNNNMQLIFKFEDIMKEIYEKQLETKIVEKNCDVNRIIDIYIIKIKKLSHKRRIVIKDYNNLIYVIGAELYVNKIDTQAKEFIIKKCTQTFKGNNKLITDEDECYITEINNQKKFEQTFCNLDEVITALTLLVQNFEKNSVSK